MKEIEVYERQSLGGEASTSPRCSSPHSDTHMSLMAKGKRKPMSEDDDDSDSAIDRLEFDHLSKKNMFKMIKFMAYMKGLEDSLERQEYFSLENLRNLKL